MHITNIHIIRILFLVMMAGFPVMVIQAQVGVKAGISGSSFYYNSHVPQPYLGYDADLRPYLGYDITWLQLGEQKALVSPYLAVYRKFDISKAFAVQPELSIVQKGVSFSGNDYEKIIYKVKITYLELPIMLKYKIVGREKFRSFLSVGGNLSTRLNATKKIEVLGKRSSEKLNNVHVLTAGICGGFDIGIPVLSKMLVIELRAYTDLSDAMYPLKSGKPIYNTIHNVRNTGFYFTLGYEF